MPTIYKITYPNGKIYVGKDMCDNINYFGSANGDLIAADFSIEERKKFTVTRETIWFSEKATLHAVNLIEVRSIRELNSNDPKIGYNRWPKFGLEKNQR